MSVIPPSLDPWFLENLVCPINRRPLTWDSSSSELVSSEDRRYPVVDGVPIMLPIDVIPTLNGVTASRTRIADGAPWYLDSVFLSDEQKQGILNLAAEGSKIDPVAAYLVAATNGLGYAHLVGKLEEYPIPSLRLPDGAGKTLLDIGCSWGRWCAAAGRKGYRPVGIDPSLGAVMAAKRVTSALGIDARFIVGDGRHLPLRDGCIDTVFSYSVIQHFSVEDAERTFLRIGRVLRQNGECLVQMPTKFGLRCLFNQARRAFREPRGFEVRYWTLRDLLQAMEENVGPAKVSIDCFLGIGWQPSDAHLMPTTTRIIIGLSEFLRKLGHQLPALRYAADSVYIQARKSV